MIIEIPKLAYMCPACGNYFYESGVRSFTIFGAIRYSDGVSQTNFDSFWMTRCPKCEQCFAIEHLFKLPFPISVGPIPVDYEKRVPKAVRERMEKEQEKYGRLGSHYFYGDEKMKFIEKVIEQGQYFPVTVSEAAKKRYKCLLYRDLWHEYNLRRDSVSDEVYRKLCSELIEMLEDQTGEEGCITLAELYRNIGDFHKCLDVIRSTNFKRVDKATVDCIRKEALRQNKMTVIVEDTLTNS